MNIIIDKKAADYIKKHSKDNAITLLVTVTGGGWCRVQSPTVKMGKPSKLETFDLYNVDNIDVYVKRGTRSRNNTLKVFIKRILFIKSIEVDGMLINY